MNDARRREMFVFQFPISGYDVTALFSKTDSSLQYDGGADGGYVIV